MTRKTFYLAKYEYLKTIPYKYYTGRPKHNVFFSLELEWANVATKHKGYNIHYQLTVLVKQRTFKMSFCIGDNFSII